MVRKILSSLDSNTVISSKYILNKYPEDMVCKQIKLLITLNFLILSPADIMSFSQLAWVYNSEKNKSNFFVLNCQKVL